MCRGRPTCSELTNREMWSSRAPLPPPAWITSQLPTLAQAMKAAVSSGEDAARELVGRIPDEKIRSWCVEHGQLSGIFRHRALGKPAAPNESLGIGPRNPNSSMTDAVLRRDRYQCRYCGLPVIPKTVHVAFSIVVGPDAYSVGRTNQERHGMALISRAQLDHVVPYGQGGVTGEENLVTACWACNYGKARFTLSQIALQDPRHRPPSTNEWDGMTSMLPLLRQRARASRNTAPLNR